MHFSVLSGFFLPISLSDQPRDVVAAAVVVVVVAVVSRIASSMPMAGPPS